MFNPGRPLADDFRWVGGRTACPLVHQLLITTVLTGRLTGPVSVFNTVQINT